jgi:hypothetical protein
MSNVTNITLSNESVSLLQHMIETERLKTIMRFYKRYSIDRGFSWELNLQKNINDSRNEKPCIIAYSKAESGSAIKLKSVVTYNLACENYNVEWYLHKNDTRQLEHVDDVTLTTNKYLAVINHIEKHLNSNHSGSDKEIPEDSVWEI